MLKYKGEGLGTQRRFLKVSESWHSPLVLVGAPCKGIAPPRSAQRPSAIYGLILHHFDMTNHSQPFTP
jgi:hypothetical protein